MENKNILLLRHHPMNVHFTNTFYTSQTEKRLDEYMIFDVTSRVTRNKDFMAKHPSFAKDLSPFFVGHVTGADGVEAKILRFFGSVARFILATMRTASPTQITSNGEITFILRRSARRI